MGTACYVLIGLYLHWLVLAAMMKELLKVSAMAQTGGRSGRNFRILLLWPYFQRRWGNLVTGTGILTMYCCRIFQIIHTHTHAIE